VESFFGHRTTYTESADSGSLTLKLRRTRQDHGAPSPDTTGECGNRQPARTST
jgi:hypothetical protein